MVIISRPLLFQVLRWVLVVMTTLLTIPLITFIIPVCLRQPFDYYVIIQLAYLTMTAIIGFYAAISKQIVWHSVFASLLVGFQFFYLPFLIAMPLTLFISLALGQAKLISDGYDY